MADIPSAALIVGKINCARMEFGLPALEDQLIQAGLADRVRFLRATNGIDGVGITDIIRI